MKKPKEPKQNHSELKSSSEDERSTTLKIKLLTEKRDGDNHSECTWKKEKLKILTNRKWRWYLYYYKKGNSIFKYMLPKSPKWREKNL